MTNLGGRSSDYKMARCVFDVMFSDDSSWQTNHLPVAVETIMTIRRDSTLVPIEIEQVPMEVECMQLHL